MERTSRLSHQIGSLLALGSGAGLSDGQLLERFLTREGNAAEAAFALLVERHGPMVLRVCRGVLPDPHDADDAFQATFLVLVRRARSLWVEDSLGPWLHQVALRTAAHARAAALRRSRHEASAARPERASTTREPDDLAPILHEEIGRLPERFRAPVVLCDLQECSHDQAARHLGWPVGTVKSRLSRARQRLRERLLRRGVAPGIVATSLSRIDAPSPLLPPEIVVATSRAAAGLATTRTMIAGPAALLAQGVIHAMNMTRWWKVACALAVAGATVAGGGLLAGRGSQAVEPTAPIKGKAATAKSDGDMPVAAASRGPFRLVVADPGVVEASQTENLPSRLWVPSKILSVIPEGTKVRKGDLVAELDSAPFQDQLTNQKIVTQGAELAYQNARLAREVAELALREYQEGIYPQDRAAIQGEINLARAAAGKAAERADRLRQSQARLRILLDRDHKPTPADLLAEVDLQDRLDAAEQAVLREKLALEKTQANLERLERFTREKTIRELRTEMEKARSIELMKQVTWQLKQKRTAKLEDQVRACRLVAPIDGVVVYADSPYRENQAERVRIAEGAEVRDGQLVARIFNLDAPMRINVHVGEPLVHRLAVGQKAAVHVHAFPDRTFTGTVLSIAPRPDEVYWQRQQRKVYPTLVQIDDLRGTPLRPGMNGDTEITITEHADVVTVPFDAILHYQDRDHVAVKREGGGFEWRAVVLGDGDPASQRVEVKQGLEPGEQVALKPADLLSEYEKRQKGLGEPTRPARRATSK